MKRSTRAPHFLLYVSLAVFLSHVPTLRVQTSPFTLFTNDAGQILVTGSDLPIVGLGIRANGLAFTSLKVIAN